MSAAGGPRRIGVVLPEVLQAVGVKGRVDRLEALAAWPEIVGTQLAEVTRVKGVDEEALVVEVRSSAWLMELSMMKDVFLERVNARLGGLPIGRIVFVLAETT